MIFLWFSYDRHPDLYSDGFCNSRWWFPFFEHPILSICVIFGLVKCLPPVFDVQNSPFCQGSLQHPFINMFCPQNNRKSNNSNIPAHPFPWFSYDLPMVFLWFSYDFLQCSCDCLMMSYDFLMISQWFPYDFLMISYSPTRLALGF